MALDIPTTIIEQHLPNPEVLHTMDLVHVALDLSTFRPVHMYRTAGVQLPDGTINHRSWEERFRLAIMCFRGVLILTPKCYGPRHAVAFEKGQIYDPRGRIYKYDTLLNPKTRWVPTEAFVIYD